MATTITTRQPAFVPGHPRPVGTESTADVTDAASAAIRQYFGNPQSDGAPAGEPLRDLPELRSMGGVLEHTLPPEHATPGQILRVRPGDTIKLTTDDGTAQAGSDQRHEYEIPADFPAGLHRYHPLGRSSPRAHACLPAPLLVEGDIDQVDGIASARERTLVIGERRPADAAPPAGLTATVNGQVLPDIDIQPGEIQRWRILNADPRRVMWFHVEGHTLHQIGQDGMPFTQARPVQSIMLVPGNRAEILIRATRPGRYRVYAGKYGHGQTGQPQPAVDLATFAVAGRPVFNPMPRGLVDGPQFATEPIAEKRTLRFTGGDGTPGRAVRTVMDGHELDLADVDRYVTAGTVEEWVLINDDATQHRFHLNGHPFQVLDVQGIPAGDQSWQTNPEIWWDTYRLPANGQVTIRAHIRA
ncbi:hypothetical protein EF847_06075 [Actinobacteria bacterium YIM 96077]|uniref:Plastocyanin-like domain-containing protein n=1 Tax=Phytoactinopolyspora halophila TaxID=1981511 RepID=A0A329QPE0_9ACTN|nr:multicopper oxidase domain-containing protein [Phytoactinopolyspora halophila]AYY12341.1 hypothetical protein EF847_06075 [Actinobacteria bacterium YIM 96077]RAW13741.1 hypothetical protein DPM12_12080 [Phytoactinopolyspora halophila]